MSRGFRASFLACCVDGEIVVRPVFSKLAVLDVLGDSLAAEACLPFTAGDVRCLGLRSGGGDIGRLALARVWPNCSSEGFATVSLCFFASFAFEGEAAVGVGESSRCRLRGPSC